MSELTYYKSFILEHVEENGDVLPLKFYCDLNPGKYIGLRLINIKTPYAFFGKHKSKSGFYENGLLCHSPSENIFFILLPCFFTVKKIETLSPSSTINSEHDVLILIKKPNRGNSPRPSSAIWENGLVTDFFNRFTQFYLYEVYCHNDEDSGKIRKLVKKDMKDYIEFVNLYYV